MIHLTDRIDFGLRLSESVDWPDQVLLPQVPEEQFRAFVPIRKGHLQLDDLKAEADRNRFAHRWLTFLQGPRREDSPTLLAVVDRMSLCLGPKSSWGPMREGHFMKQVVRDVALVVDGLVSRKAFTGDDHGGLHVVPGNPFETEELQLQRDILSNVVANRHAVMASFQHVPMLSVAVDDSHVRINELSCIFVATPSNQGMWCVPQAQTSVSKPRFTESDS